MSTLAAFGVGLLAWTLLEYVIHHPLGHLPRGRILISSEHLHHHRDVLYFTPLALKVRGAIPVLLVVGALAALLSSPAVAAGFVLGIVAGWTFYEVVHQDIHVRGPRTAYGRWIARNHLFHHFGSARTNHGVTTPLWDHLLGTHAPARAVRIPRQQLASIPWLARALAADPARRPDFLADYEVI